MKKQYRQGDVFIQNIEEMPKELKKIISGVVVIGEATGHAHRLIGGEVFKDKMGKMFLDVKKTAQLIHDEHKPIVLVKGKWAVVRQREYVSSDMTKIIVD